MKWQKALKKTVPHWKNHRFSIIHILFFDLFDLIKRLQDVYRQFLNMIEKKKKKNKTEIIIKYKIYIHVLEITKWNYLKQQHKKYVF